MPDETITLDVNAKTDCICYSISRDSLSIILGKDFRNIIFKNYVRESFSKSEYFKGISFDMIEKLYPFFKMKSFAKSDIIYKNGSKKYSKIIIVIEGNIIDVKNDLN